MPAAIGTTKDENVIPAPEPESRVRRPTSSSAGLGSRFRGSDKADILKATT